MKTASKVVLCGTSALFAVVLGLQAQTTTTSNNTTRSNQQRSDTLQSSPSTTSNNQTDSRYSSPSSTTSNNQSSSLSSSPGSTTSNRSSSLSSSTAESDRSSAQSQRDRSPEIGSSSATSNNTTSLSGNATTSGSLNSSTSETSTLSSQSSVTATAETDTKVTTLVQEIDSQGAVVVDRIATQFSDFACTEENARMLVEALHGGTAVTLTGDDGQTVTFEPNVQLNYGEAYLALALAAETLRANGVTGCATPEQWRAVLVGGPLSVSSSTTTTASASASSDFPGILVLHSQGQAWSQIAQTSNVEISQIVSTAHSSLNIESGNLAGATGEMDAESSSGTSDDQPPYGKAKGHDKDKKDKKDKSDRWQDKDSPPRASDRGEEKKSDKARDNTPPRY